MLAVQKAPRMGSTQPESDPLLPFGYSLDPAQEPILDAPDPAPGDPLLTENDNRILSCFFEDITSNQYTIPSFGEGLNFSDAWLGLPPQFMGTATSYGSQSAAPIDPPRDPSFSAGDQPLHLARVIPSETHLMPPPPPPASHATSFHHHHSDDVLNAAATLVQNTNVSRGGAPKTGDAHLPRRSLGYPVGHLRHQPLEEFRAENRRSSLETGHDHQFIDWMWSPRAMPTSRKPNVPLDDFQWGSDASFGPTQSYAPEPNKDSVDAMQQTQLRCLDCLQVNPSVDNTRSNSPVNGRGALDNGESSAYIKREEEHNVPPRKRRKSENVKEMFADDDDDENDDDAGKRRRSRTDRIDTSPLADATSAGPSRRRKSTANGAKPPRENLTEEQKRENHIRSEQKRRTLIKEGFDDLGELVPGLKGGGFSKSTTLTMAAEWLEDLMGGNQALAAQLAELDGKK
ncbi:hypothetical protein XA68_16028 [Ophiocordyceps unilateralis]|uniref:BHLH domain-containing protein n=1 Tax=Ophiocordyceps unilateralis TaxID=268505 RepID=A0A2A9P605_OPHUN|nr:hypothetical protein XA68_16028 [Ophiocordyceps unilateralis]